MTLIREMSGDIDSGNVRLECLLIVDRNLAVLSAGRSLDSKILQQREVRVGPDEDKDDVVWKYIDLTVLVFEHDAVVGDLDDASEEEQFQAMVLQLFFERLLDPVLDTALLRIGVLLIAAKDRERGVGTFSGEKQCGLSGRVPPADDQRAFLHPRISLAEMIEDLG